MDADTERGRTPRERRRIVECRTAGHDGRRAQDAACNALLHGAVDERVPTEIVGVQNDLLQVVFLMSFYGGMFSTDVPRERLGTSAYKPTDSHIIPHFVNIFDKKHEITFSR